MTQDALYFWRGQLGEVSPDLAQWLAEQVADVQVLWGHVGTMNRSRGMWKMLSEALEAADPTNPWTRNYDRLYFDSQLVTLTRLVFKKKSRLRQFSLASFLDEFARQPRLCAELRLDGRQLVCGPGPVDPAADKAIIEGHVRQLMPWRDKRVTHIERDESLPPITWEELDQSINAVTEVFSRYSSRLTGVNYHVDFTESRWHAWRSIFAKPLFDGEGRPIIPAERVGSDFGEGGPSGVVGETP